MLVLEPSDSWLLVDIDIIIKPKRGRHTPKPSLTSFSWSLFLCARATKYNHLLFGAPI